MISSMLLFFKVGSREGGPDVDAPSALVPPFVAAAPPCSAVPAVVPAALPAGLPPNRLDPVVVVAGALVVGAAADDVAVVAPVVVGAEGWDAGAAEAPPKSDPAGLDAAGADVVGAAEVVVAPAGFPNKLPPVVAADVEEDVVADELALPNKPPDAGVVDAAGAALAEVAAGLGFAPNRPPLPEGAAVLGWLVAVDWAPPPKRLGVDDAVVAGGFWPKRLEPPASAGLATPGAPWPNREEVPVPEVCGAGEAVVVPAAPAPPKRDGVEEGLDDACAPPSESEGAPAGVVEVVAPNKGFAGVAWPAGVELAPPPKSEPPAGAEVVGVVELACAPLVPPVVPPGVPDAEPPPKRLDDVEGAEVAGFPKALEPLVVAPPAGFPKRLVPVWAPVVGVDELFPNNPPEPVDGAAVEPPPKRLPPLVEVGLVVGVDENMPPGLAAAPPL